MDEPSIHPSIHQEPGSLFPVCEARVTFTGTPPSFSAQWDAPNRFIRMYLRSVKRQSGVAEGVNVIRVAVHCDWLLHTASYANVNVFHY